MSQEFYPENNVSYAGEETLRQLAKAAPPAGLEDRVHARLRHALDEPEPRGFWSLWGPGRRLQFAGAAALVLAVAGSILMTRHVPAVQPQAATAAPVVQSPLPAPRPAFGTAGAEAHPSSLKPIKVLPSQTSTRKSSAGAHKKPSASRVARPGSAPTGSTP